MNARRIRSLLLGIAVACAATATGAAGRDLRMSTTTSTDNSGLLNFLMPAFEQKTGIKVRWISVGTGKALELGKNGDVDVVLVHARAAEDKFVAEGRGVNRRDVMYNDFIIVGPPADPLGVKGNNALAAFGKIAGAKSARFISRGDNSGTDQMEKSYWKELGVTPGGAWFVSAGLGMGEVLAMAGEMQAYTLTDRATYSSYKAKTGLTILVEGDPKLFNPYGIIAVNPAQNPGVDYTGAMALIDWITSPEGQKKIGEYRIAGEQQFFPNAR